MSFKVMGLSSGDKIIDMDRRAAWKVIQRTALKVLGRKVHPHMFRHGFVYAQVQEGHHPYLIAGMVGHASLSSTLSYFHPTTEELGHARGKTVI